MKIKNIRQYRSEYKVKSRGLGETRDEHFVGTFYHDDQDNKKYGWFDIYHGDKEGYDRIEEGIGNFLQSFLDMAKDGQAVYEFLQNAVDAGSSHFSMFWGEDEIDGNQYALIANNGAMFGFDNVRSILNVGSSTKSSNSHTIGKFGIGFKLAHRLVGKENGLDELLANYSGPILFSWKNNEIEQLAAAEDIEPVDVRLTKRVDNPREYEIKDDNPWLFKILLTCFPCLPENDFVTDEIMLLDEDGTASDIFNKEEYEVFCRWVQKYSDILKANDYREGSLIFIKLGAGKEADLADQNLASGIKFSLAVLEKTADKTSGADSVLKTVQLNRDHVIEYPELNYLPFYISRKGEDRNDYVYIRFGLDRDAELTEEQLKILEKETDIEVLFGFRDFDKIDDYFKGAPNFYLYFPLSEEVHNFNFILHSNAFYKASSRTFLHKGTGTDYGINERLLSKITERVDKELYRLYEAKDANFIHLYVSLLTSGCSLNQERKWIKEPFIDKIDAILMKYIPVKSEDGLGYEIREKSGAIYIKGTQVDVPLDREVYWFYFEQEEITWEARGKLGLQVFDIFQLLDIPGIYSSINEWIGTDEGRIEIILQELDQGFWAKPSETQKINLLNLCLFSFSDGRFASALEVGQIQEEGYLVAYNKISEVAPVIRKGGLHVTSIDFNRYNFVPKIMSYLSNTHQLKNHDKTVEVFSRCVKEEVLGGLPAGEKLAVFRALRDLNDERKHDRISNLKLLKNRAGDYVPFKSLLKKAPAGWLKKYEVAEGESHPDYASYLLDDEAKYYERIVYPYWQDILGDLITSQEEERWKVKREIRELYDRCDYEDKRQLLLKNHSLIPYLGTVIKTSNVFYHDEPDKIYVGQYEGIQQLVEKLSGVYIPDYFYLNFIDEDPFELEKVEVGFPEEMSLSGAEALQLFIFLHAGGEKIFEEYVVFENEAGDLKLIERDIDEYVYYTESGPVKEYINTYHAGNFFLCPEKYKEFTTLGVMTKEVLFNQLIELLDEEDEEQRIDFLGILPHSEELQKILFEKIDSFVLDVAWEKEKENKAYLKYLSALISNDIIEDGKVQDKIEFRKGDATIYLNDIGVVDDEIALEIDGGRKFRLSKTKVLNLTDEVGITDIRMFADEAVSKGFISEKDSIILFNLGKTAVDKELIDTFNNSLMDMQIENAHQLAFVLCCKQIPKDDISSYKVKDIEEDWSELSGNWLLPFDNSEGLYRDCYILSTDYEELIDLLKFQEEEALFYGDEETEDSYDYISPVFRFRRGCDIDVFNEDAGTVPLLKELCDCWKKTKKSNLVNSSEWNWCSILRFAPSSKIYDNQNRVVAEEELDPEIIAWLEEKETNLQFAVKALGLHSENSAILKLREGLLTGSKALEDVDIYSIDPLFLQNTLIGLADGFLNGQTIGPYTKNSKQFAVINSIIQRVMTRKNWDIRVHIYTGLERFTLGSENEDFPFYLDQGMLELISKDNRNKPYLKNLFKKEQIVFRQEFYEEYVKKYYTELEIDDVLLIDSDCREHTEYYYKKWKEETGISLFRANSIWYKVSVEIDDFSYELGEIERIGSWYDLDMRQKVLYYPKCIGLESLSELLREDGYTDYSNKIDSLIEGRESLLINLSKNLDEDDEADLKKLLDEKFEEQGKEERRKELAGEISSEIPYSHRWFEIYLEYLATFEETVDTFVQKSISFQQITLFVNAKGIVSVNYFLLKGASKIIPVSLESYTDFEIELSFGPKKKVKIKVESVSKKGQDLLVFCPGGIDERIKEDFDNVKSVAIYFRPGVELIKKLQSEFSILEPWEDILVATQPLHFIYGPPGTGKTTTLSNLLIEETIFNPELKALILTPTNKAGDVLAGKILKESPSTKVIRLSPATDPALDECIYKSGVNEEVLTHTNIVISTIHRLPYTQVELLSDEFLKLYDAHWDYVVFDESSMISLPYFVFALQAVKRNNTEAKIIIAGDPKQIPPIVEATDKQLEEMDLSDISIYTIFNVKEFNKASKGRKCDKVTYLDTQYRSVQEIGRLFSNYSYGGKIKHGRDMAVKPRKKLPSKFPTSLKKPVVFIDVPVEDDNSITLPKKLFYSSYHIYSALFVTELVKNLAGKMSGEEFLRIGIISPYKAQAVIMGKLVTYLDIPYNLDVRCDTIHGFQGDECDIIIYVVNPNNKSFTHNDRSLINKEYIYNVAISRAQDYLWIINPFVTGNPHVEGLKDDAFSIMKGGEIVDCQKLEKYFLKSENFITRNSHMTGHDNVNIFGFTEDMSYYIKAGENTIDIQLKK